ncbi:hypothetical protein FOA52_012746 [Chlamydomonas sp. UWO 241]|nr:hypothetical protein FOA52_012746 [Chlamydomonas sp. UWO 241]
MGNAAPPRWGWEDVDDLLEYPRRDLAPLQSSCAAASSSAEYLPRLQRSSLQLHHLPSAQDGSLRISREYVRRPSTSPADAPPPELASLGRRRNRSPCSHAYVDAAPARVAKRGGGSKPSSSASAGMWRTHTTADATSGPAELLTGGMPSRHRRSHSLSSPENMPAALPSIVELRGPADGASSDSSMQAHAPAERMQPQQPQQPQQQQQQTDAPAAAVLARPHAGMPSGSLSARSRLRCPGASSRGTSRCSSRCSSFSGSPLQLSPRFGVPLLQAAQAQLADRALRSGDGGRPPLLAVMMDLADGCDDARHGGRGAVYVPGGSDRGVPGALPPRLADEQQDESCPRAGSFSQWQGGGPLSHMMPLSWAEAAANDSHPHAQLSPSPFEPDAASAWGKWHTEAIGCGDYGDECGSPFLRGDEAGDGEYGEYEHCEWRDDTPGAPEQELSLAMGEDSSMLWAPSSVAAPGEQQHPLLHSAMPNAPAELDLLPTRRSQPLPVLTGLVGLDDEVVDPASFGAWQVDPASFGEWQARASASGTVTALPRRIAQQRWHEQRLQQLQQLHQLRQLQQLQQLQAAPPSLPIETPRSTLLPPLTHQQYQPHTRCTDAHAAPDLGLGAIGDALMSVRSPSPASMDAAVAVHPYVHSPSGSSGAASPVRPSPLGSPFAAPQLQHTVFGSVAGGDARYHGMHAHASSSAHRLASSSAHRSMLAQLELELQLPAAPRVLPAVSSATGDTSAQHWHHQQHLHAAGASSGSHQCSGSHHAPARAHSIHHAAGAPLGGSHSVGAVVATTKCGSALATGDSVTNVLRKGRFVVSTTSGAVGVGTGCGAGAAHLGVQAVSAHSRVSSNGSGGNGLERHYSTGRFDVREVAPAAQSAVRSLSAMRRPAPLAVPPAPTQLPPLVPALAAAGSTDAVSPSQRRGRFMITTTSSTTAQQQAQGQPQAQQQAQGQQQPEQQQAQPAAPPLPPLLAPAPSTGDRYNGSAAAAMVAAAANAAAAAAASLASAGEGVSVRGRFVVRTSSSTSSPRGDGEHSCSGGSNELSVTDCNTRLGVGAAAAPVVTTVRPRLTSCGSSAALAPTPAGAPAPAPAAAPAPHPHHAPPPDGSGSARGGGGGEPPAGRSRSGRFTVWEHPHLPQATGGSGAS